MATLSGASFAIDELTGMPYDVKVTATVNIGLTKYEKFLVQAELVDFTLKSEVWGIDASSNDSLFHFSDQMITGEGTYTFSRIVPRSLLNEDHSLFNYDDEIATRFNLSTNDPAFPQNVFAMTPTLVKRF